MTHPAHAEPPISTVESLRAHLQTALEIEHSTIPPYLCALYSIEAGANREAARVIQSVVMEEMLHMTLVANVLNAVGGSPSIDCREFVPSYPTFLRHSDDAFKVGLLKFSPPALETFLKIEHPVPAKAPPQPHKFHSLAQFYKAIREAVKTLEEDARRRGSTIFTGPAPRQIQPADFYGSGGAVIAIVPPDAPGKPTALALALEALDEILEQGEGFPGKSIEDGDRRFGQRPEPAHYFRFKEILVGRYYRPSDDPKKGPTGPVFPVDWSSVWDMAPNPKAGHYTGSPDIYREMVAFNRGYTSLLRLLHRAFNGEPQCLAAAAPAMYGLRDRATALMKIPTGTGTATVGPSFEYWPD